MAGSVTTVTAWADAIVAALRPAFGSECELIGAYNLFDQGGSSYPKLTGQHALLLRAGDAEVVTGPGVRDRQGITIEWTVTIAVPTNAERPDLLALDRAIRVATFIRQPGTDRNTRANRWGLDSAVFDTDPITPSLPEWDDVDQHGYLLRPVRWRQTGYFQR